MLEYHCNGFTITTNHECYITETPTGVTGIEPWSRQELFVIYKTGSVYIMERYDSSIDINWSHIDMDSRLVHRFSLGYNNRVVIDHADVIPKLPVNAEIDVTGTDINLLLNLPNTDTCLIRLHHYQLDKTIVDSLLTVYETVWFAECQNRELTAVIPFSPDRMMSGFNLDNVTPPRSIKVDYYDWIECIIISPKLRQATIPGVSDHDIKEYLSNLDEDDLAAVMDAEITH